MRITTFSPKEVGSVETRSPTSAEPMRSLVRPSCGMKWLETSRSDMILMRETTAPTAMWRGRRITFFSSPSTRIRTWLDFSSCSIWMSEEPLR